MTELLAAVPMMGEDEAYHHLHGSCACERNQYTIYIPTITPTSSVQQQAQVFFDNSASNRRSQAAPLTAWLRVPLESFHSRTVAYLPDETHGSIRRTYHTGDAGAVGGVKRRQFCGYCGTHLTAFEEGRGEEEEWMDVTLGSLGSDSLGALEGMGVLAASDEEDEDEGEGVEGDTGGEVGMGDTADPSTTAADMAVTSRAQQPSHLMQNRGMPYFESMVENSRLGRIKLQKGGHTSRDGRTTVQWEVVEIGGGDEAGEGTVTQSQTTVTGGNKRPRLNT